jgi:hypothetical protein
MKALVLGVLVLLTALAVGFTPWSALPFAGSACTTAGCLVAVSKTVPGSCSPPCTVTTTGCVPVGAIHGTCTCPPDGCAIGCACCASVTQTITISSGCRGRAVGGGTCSNFGSFCRSVTACNTTSGTSFNIYVGGNCNGAVHCVVPLKLLCTMCAGFSCVGC